MKLYRFSPVKSEEELMQAIKHLHIEVHKLCKNSFGSYLPVTGNIGFFCHYEEEFAFLKNLQKEMCDLSEANYGKYFKLKKEIKFPENDGVPGQVYTHLYIRQPDIYRSQVGDIDFFLEEKEYLQKYSELQNGRQIKGARIYPSEAKDMIELFDPDVDVLGYIVSN